MELAVAEVLQKVRKALDQHEASCSLRPLAVLLCPGNFSLLGFEELWEVPLKPHRALKPMRFRVECAGCDSCEQELSAPVQEEAQTVLLAAGERALAAAAA